MPCLSSSSNEDDEDDAVLSSCSQSTCEDDRLESLQSSKGNGLSRTASAIVPSGTSVGLSTGMNAFMVEVLCRNLMAQEQKVSSFAAFKLGRENEGQLTSARQHRRQVLNIKM